jgi:hypothetical protein
MEALAETSGKLVNLMRAVNLYGLARSVENNFAMSTVAQVSLQFGARLGGHCVVDQVIEEGEELFTGHFSTPVSS